MTAIDDTPENLNALQQLNFVLHIPRAPNVNFFCQRANIPSIRLNVSDAPTPIIAYAQPGDHLEYEDLQVTFQVAEDLSNYLELHNWIRSLGRLQPADYYALSQNSIISGNGTKSDIMLSVLSNHKNPIYNINFHGAFPTFISGLEFNVTDSDIDYLTAVAIFHYTYFDISPIT